ncbi:hypothetical protein SAMN05421806_112134 [Streptomyces indicus]|uniref:DUF2269 domain-containing protein n=1 Tax=Streptomyces indicus TaxID=417292 RepID=A0A1G9EYX4_9ACTN|nr:hypothetical protein SAMN05421806_112134 [Streptomyces indicus]
MFHVKLSRPVRRATLVVHVTAAAGWLGLTLGLLALAAAAITTESAAVTEASVRSMQLFADWLVLPLALLTLLSGLLLALGTPWGLARHRWVFVKFWLTLATTAASTFALRPGVTHNAEVVAAGGALPDPTDLIMGPVVSLSAYVFMTVISVLKPWGLTKRGRRLKEQTGRRPKRETGRRLQEQSGGRNREQSGRKHRTTSQKALDASVVRPPA